MLRAIAIVAVLCLTACDDAPSKNQCEQLIDKLLTLEAQAESEGKDEIAAVKKAVGKEMTDLCKKDAPRGVVECMLKQSSVDAMEEKCK